MGNETSKTPITIITLSSSPEAYQRIRDLFDKGELTEVAGIKILAVEEVTNDPPSPGA
jgi:hypothetical protein